MNLLGNVIAYIVPFIAGLSVLIFAHELGHYLFARLNNVKVETFSIGFGREIWGRTDKRGTRWKIAWLPFGGYVMMLGDKDAASAPDAGKLASMSEGDLAQTLYSKSPLQRIAVSGGGPLGNYIYGFLVMTAVFFFKGAPDNRLTVKEVADQSPAAEAGIIAGDVVESAAENKIENHQDLNNIVAKSGLEAVYLRINRNGTALNIAVTPKEMDCRLPGETVAVKRKMLGLVFAPSETVKVGLWGAITNAGKFCVKISGDIMRALMRLVSSSDGAKNLGGPVRIAQLFGDIFRTGDMSKLLVFSAMLSINLGFVNLLPLPALDGGSIFISLIELVARRPLNRQVQELIMRLGFVFLCVLMLLVTCNDILHMGILSKIKGIFAGFCQ
ncbi:MAG: RIP metalloprotease RseP [Holosporales bacterium]|nr:RIP metalloprotease RseP [Holosporales bacterium]